MTHSKKEVLSFLRSREVAAIGTSNMGSPRQRMMHFAVSDHFELYLTSTKGDPKIIQWVNIPETAILIHRGDEFIKMEETEIVGRAVIIKDELERERAIELLETKSPIVAHFKEIGALDRLEFIKIIPYYVKYRYVPEIMQGKAPTVFDFTENQNKSGAWEDVRAKLRAWKEATRPLSLTATIVPILLGTSVAYAIDGGFHWHLFLLTLIGALMIQAGTNMINDWKDAETDGQNIKGVRPFTGGSRMIQLGLIARGDMGLFGFLLSLLAAMIGLYLIIEVGIGLVPLIISGLLAGIIYTGEKGKFSFINLAPGIAELLIATSYGVFMTMGAFFVQAGHYSLEAILISIPVALFITNVLIINQFQDEESDRKSKKQTLVVRLGKKHAKNIFISSIIIGYVWIGLLPIVNLAPYTIYLAFLSIPFAIQAIRYANQYYDKDHTDLIPSNAHTAITHLFSGLLLTLAYLMFNTHIYLSIIYFLATLLFVFWVWNYIERQRKVMNTVKVAFR